ATLRLALPLALARRARASLTLTLLALTLTLTLLTLALPLLTGIREVPPRLLETRCGPGEIPVDRDVLVGALEGLTQAVQRLLSRGVVALGEALGRLAEGRARGAVRLARYRLQAGELGRQRL